MHSVWMGEFAGTLVLVLLGTGINAGVTLRKSYAADSGWIAITTGWALAVLCGVLVAQAFGSPGANLNPAITLALAVNGGDYAQVLSMWSAQLVGAMIGAALMALHYGPHWKLTPGPVDKLGVFCTNAAVRSPFFNILSEALGTAVLVVVAVAIGSRGVSATGPAAGVGPWLVACLVWGIGLSLGGTTAHRSLAIAHSRQRRLQLALCADPADRRPRGRGAGRAAAALCASVIEASFRHQSSATGAQAFRRYTRRCSPSEWSPRGLCFPPNH